MNEICDKCLTCHWYCDDVLEECKGQEEPCHEYSPCMEIRRAGEPNGQTKRKIHYNHEIKGSVDKVDDLISRKAAYKAFSDYLNRNFIGEVSSQTELSIGEIASVIKSIPAAFDKEKVIKELKTKAEDSRKYWSEFDDEDAFGEMNAYKNAIEIVEKGGIE